MDFDADLDIFFADSDSTAAINGGAPVPCIFWVPGKAIDMFNGGVSSTDPGMLVKSSSLAGADNGTSVVIAGAPEGNGSYTIMEIASDGMGLAVVTLTKA